MYTGRTWVKLFQTMTQCRCGAGCLEVKMVRGRRTVLANRREDKRKRVAPSTTPGGKTTWHGQLIFEARPNVFSWHTLSIVMKIYATLDHLSTGRSRCGWLHVGKKVQVSDGERRVRCIMTASLARASIGSNGTRGEATRRFATRSDCSFIHTRRCLQQDGDIPCN